MPSQSVVALFPEKRTIYREPADLMMRHWVAEAAPELDHLHADAAWGGATSSHMNIRRGMTAQRPWESGHLL